MEGLAQAPATQSGFYPSFCLFGLGLFLVVSPAIEMFGSSLITLVNPCAQAMHQYFCLLRQSKFSFWVVLL